MRDQALLIALARTARAIRDDGKNWTVTLIDAAGIERIVSPEVAAEFEYARPGLYCGSGSARRVKRMEWKPTPAQDHWQWEACWRNSRGSACLWSMGRYEPHQA